MLKSLLDTLVFHRSVSVPSRLSTLQSEWRPLHSICLPSHTSHGDSSATHLYVANALVLRYAPHYVKPIKQMNEAAGEARSNSP